MTTHRNQRRGGRRVVTLALGAAVGIGGAMWLVLAVWLSGPLPPCPFEGTGPCDRPRQPLMLLASAMLPGVLATLTASLSLLRYGAGGRPPRHGALQFFIAGASLATTSVGFSLLAGE